MLTISNSKRALLLLNVLLFSLVPTGCSFGPDYQRPELDLAPHYRDKDAAEAESIANIKWWEFFKDPQLQDLVRIGLKENKNLLIALARIDEARAVLGVTQADQYPRLDLAANATRTDPSDVIVLGGGSPRNDFGIFGDLSFEIDLWGRVRRATEADRAQLLSTEYAYQSVTLTLVSSVAAAYFVLLDLDNRDEIAKRTIENRKGATKVIRERFQGGTVPELDVNQAEIEEEDAIVTAASIRREIRQTENALNVLLGRSNFPIPRGKLSNDQKFYDSLPAGFPAALLERRPDVISAEEATHAAYARIGVAQALRLPTIDLLGFVGLQSGDDSDLFDHDGFTWSIGGQALGPIIDFGKSSSNVDIAKAQAEQAVQGYEQTVLQAVQDVEDALIGVETYREESQSRGRQSKAASNAARLSRARYDDGVSSYLEVLDAERSQFEAELGHSQAQQRYLNSIVLLYKALGGGWDREPAATPKS